MPPIGELVRLLDFGLLFAILCFVSISDVKRRCIPNWAIVAVAGLFIPWAMVGGSDSILSSLGAALLALLLSATMYVFGLVGAGDSKLLAVCALFVGLGHLLQFFVLMALAGGVLAIVTLTIEPRRALVMFQTRGAKSAESGIPYGVAIAIAAIGVVGLPVVRSVALATWV
jgi:prepilin peptidase CpaA